MSVSTGHDFDLGRVEFFEIGPGDAVLLREAFLDVHHHETRLTPWFGGDATSDEQFLEEVERKWPKWLSESGQFCIGARLGERVVGFSACDKEEGDPDWQTGDPIGYIGWLGVVEDLRGRGIGTRLVELSIERFAELGYKSFMIDSMLANTEAHRLYERFATKAWVGFIGSVEQARARAGGSPTQPADIGTS